MIECFLTDTQNRVNSDFLSFFHAMFDPQNDLVLNLLNVNIIEKVFSLLSLTPDISLKAMKVILQVLELGQEIIEV